jgi:hypothetical protein
MGAGDKDNHALGARMRAQQSYAKARRVQRAAIPMAIVSQMFLVRQAINIA